MIVSICMLRSCMVKSKILPNISFMKPFYQILNIPVKSNRVLCFHNLHCKLTLSPDAKQRNEDLRELSNSYNMYWNTSSKKIPEINVSELSDFLSVSLEKAEEIMSILVNRIKAKNTPSYYLKQNIDLLRKYKVVIDSFDIPNIQNIIRHPPVILESRLEFMEETTMRMTFRNLKSLHHKGWQKMEFLEGTKVVEPDLPLKIFKNLNVPENILKLLPPPSVYQKLTLSELWIVLIEILVNWKLSCLKGPVKISRRSIGRVYNSLRSVEENMSLLQNKMKFSTKKILTYPQILTCCSSNLKLYVNEPDPELRHFATKFPDILKNPYESTKQIYAMLRFLSGGNMLPNGSGLLIQMRPKEVFNRLEKLIGITSLTDLRLTPNYFRLIYRIDLCLDRLGQDLDKEEIKCFPAVRTLEIPEDSNYRRLSGVRLFLKEILNLSVSKNDMNMMNMIHFPELSCMKKNLVFLCQKGFSWEELRNAFHVLLFPHNILVENYTKMLTCSYASEFRKNNDSDKVLQLLIYYMSIQYKEIGGSY